MVFKEIIKDYKSPGDSRQPYEKWLDYKNRMKLEKVIQKIKLRGEAG